MEMHLIVSDRIEKRFITAAQRKGLDPSSLFEAMVDEYLPIVEENEPEITIYERFKDLIGTVEGLPADMSQNLGKYMSGFGETRSGD